MSLDDEFPGITQTEPLGKATFFAFDVETTGLDPQTDQIVSIAYRILTDKLEVLDSRIFYAFPEVPVHPRAAAVNGYSAEAWTAKGALTQSQLAGQLSSILEWRRRLLPLGHNVGFDLAFLKALFVKHELDGKTSKSLSYHTVDTITASVLVDMALFGTLHGKYSLVDLCKRFDIQHAAAHTADSDIDATIALFAKLCSAINPTGVKQGAVQAAGQDSGQDSGQGAGQGPARLAPPTQWCPMFGQDDSGVWYIYQGKHKNKKLDDVAESDASYITWMSKKLDNLSPAQRACLNSLIAAMPAKAEAARKLSSLSENYGTKSAILPTVTTPIEQPTQVEQPMQIEKSGSQPE